MLSQLPQELPLEELRTPSYRTPHNTLQRLPSVLLPSVNLEDRIIHFAAMPSGQGPLGAHLTMYQHVLCKFDCL